MARKKKANTIKVPLTPSMVIWKVIKTTEKLRKEYLIQFKAGFRQQLDGVKVVDEKGNDITPIKKGEA